eukprot:5397540-Pyramimonas_sp.AAC.1
MATALDNPPWGPWPAVDQRDFQPLLRHQNYALSTGSPSWSQRSWIRTTCAEHVGGQSFKDAQESPLTVATSKEL